MKGTMGLLPGIAILVIITCSYIISPGIAGAQPPIEDCVVGIIKLATPDDGTEFTFLSDEGGVVTEFNLIHQDEQTIGFPRTVVLEVVEVVPDNWELVNIECNDNGNVNITIIENGIVAVCVGPEGSGSCVFENVLRERPIPTLSEWGMIAAAAGLALVGVFFATRRKRAVVNS